MSLTKPSIPLRSAVCMVGLLVFIALRTSAQDQDLAAHAKAILKNRCVSCHGPGGIAAQHLFGLSRAAMLGMKVVVPNDPNSDLLKQVEGGLMPLGVPKLPAEEIQALKDWVLHGAPDWDPSSANVKPAGEPAARPFLTESHLLKLIQKDLENADERSRPFLRYYSIAHLYNSDEEDLQLYRDGLSKLLNSLSWNRIISKPVPIDPEKTLLRIDLRDFNWSVDTWKTILAAYPFGIRYRDAEAAEIRDLSGAEIPYVRADWFVAHASLPPLYNDILGLPQTVSGLEDKLGVHSAQDLEQEKNVLRGGVRISGVSSNNRVMERHVSNFGAYWKSFDFKKSDGPNDIFQNPIDIKPDAGEFIFNLPNGMQAYFISNADGNRLDEALIEIVSDHNNPLDRTVRNGRSCMNCHYSGMNPFTDKVRQTLENDEHVDFDLEKAKALYPGQEEIDKSLHEDNVTFRRAVEASEGKISESPANEPIFYVSFRYAEDLTQKSAASEAGLDEKSFIEKLKRSSKLDELGFGQLIAPDGGMKRDEWERNFGVVVQELRLGDFLPPDHAIEAATPAAAGRTVSIGNIEASDPAQARAIRSDLAFYLGQSPSLRVASGAANVTLKGSLKESDGTVTISVSDPASGLLEEVTGSPRNLGFLAEQLANRISFRLTRKFLPTPPAPADSGTPSRIGRAPTSELVLPPPGSSPIRLALSVDRGADSTYHINDSVTVRFKADRDCHVTLYNIDSKGDNTLLFPNKFDSDTRVEANRIYTVPAPNDSWEFFIRNDGSLGPEKVVAIATINPFDGPGAEKLPEAKDFVDLGNDLSSFTKSLGVRAKNQRDEGFSTATVQFFSAP